MKNTEKTMDKIVALCKNRGIIFAGSEIYGGLANTWDYGPLGVELKNNIKKAWWKKFVQENPYNVGQDAAILMNPQTWVASGHLAGFSDPLMDCKECKERFRADKLIEDWCQTNGVELPKPIDAFSQQEMKDFIEEKNIPCPTCGKHNFTDIRQFNLMFKTFQGVTEDAKNTVYLRPETAQGIFTNFVNTQRTTRRKLPFGVCQIGKSFRNEITPGNFIFRVREFEQMELEFFCKPGTDLEWFNYWRTFCHNWLLGIGLKDENLRLRDHDPEELCFYSKATTDFEFLFPFGWGELWGVADRTDYDLTQHQNVSGKDLTYFDPETNERYIPYVVEPSLGVERSVLAVLVDAYDEEVVDAEKNDVRVVLHLHPALAPYKAAVLPLSKKLSDKAREVYAELAKEWMIDFDETGSIGKRYRREDEVGTPYCITVDFDTVGDAEKAGDNCVTVRERDTMEQVRVPISELKAYLAENDFDAIVITHLYPAEALTYLKRRGELRQKVLAIATDYTCIPFWEETNCDDYVIPHKDLIPEFASYGISKEKLLPLGIPVRPAFSRPASKEDVRRHLGLPEDAPLFLVMSGSMGFGKVHLLAHELVSRLKNGEQVVIICGNNKKRARSLRLQFHKNSNVHVVGFTRHVAEYMAAADVLFTKPGGLSSTEAAVRRVPLVHTDPIPGCETKNRAFFVSRGMSVTGTHQKELADAGISLAKDDARQIAMRDAQRENSHPQAGTAITHLLEKLVSE